MVACGHTYEQVLHWMHFVGSQRGTSGGTKLPLAVGVILEGGDGQAVAVHHVDRGEQLLDLLHDCLAALEGEGGGLVGGIGPVSRHLELAVRAGAGLDGLVVGVDDGLALLHVGLGRSVLHVLDGILGRKHLGQREERIR